MPTNTEDIDEEEDTTVLPESISISKIEDLLAQMRFHEVPKRAMFSVPFQLGEGFTIGVKGFVVPITFPPIHFLIIPQIWSGDGAEERQLPLFR